MVDRRIVVGRALVLSGALAAVGYLVWRLGWSWQGARWWLAAPMLAVEIVGVIGAVLLAWALWPGSAGPIRRGRPIEGSIDAVVRADGHPDAEIRATLIAIRRVWAIERVHVATSQPTAALHQAAADHHAEVVRLDPEDPAALLAAAQLTSDWVLLLDAGDVPAADVLVRCSDVLADDVAAVQATVTSIERDSAEHQADGHHELRPERLGLLPALGVRGTAFITESNTLIRRAALADVGADVGHREMASWATSVRLWRRGWRVVTTGREPVGVRPSRREHHHVIADRTIRARAARALVVGPDGALRGSGFTLGQRLSMLAWAVRPLAGFRRSLFMLVIGGSLLAGRAPFHLEPVPVAVGVAAVFVALPLGLYLLSDWTLRPGDRTRWSLRTLGPAWRSLATPSAGSGLPIVSTSPVFSFHLAPTIVVVGISVVVAMRAVSERVTGALHQFPERDLVAMLLVALWILAMALDSLRLLGMGRRLRRAERRPSALSADVDGSPAFIVDLSVAGAGIVMPTAPLPGTRLVVRTDVPHGTGCTTVELPAVVRHVRRDIGGQWLVGTEFTAVPAASADALAEYAVVDPAAARLHDQPGTRPNGAVLLDTSGRSAALRTIAFSGLAGALVSVDVITDRGTASQPAGVAVVVLAALVGFGVVLGTRHASR